MNPSPASYPAASTSLLCGPEPWREAQGAVVLVVLEHPQSRLPVAHVDRQIPSQPRFGCGVGLDAQPAQLFEVWTLMVVKLCEEVLDARPPGHRHGGRVSARDLGEGERGSFMVGSCARIRKGTRAASEPAGGSSWERPPEGPWQSSAVQAVAAATGAMKTQCRGIVPGGVGVGARLSRRIHRCQRRWVVRSRLENVTGGRRCPYRMRSPSAW